MSVTIRSHALLMESLQYFNDKALVSLVERSLGQSRTWRVIGDQIHDYGCPRVQAAHQEHDSPPNVKLLLGEAWGKTCDECPDLLETLLGHDTREVLHRATGLAGVLSWKGEKHLILSHQSIERCMAQVERYRYDYVLDAVDAGIEIQARVAQAIGEAPREHLQDHAALHVAGMRLLEQHDEPTASYRSRWELASVSSAWRMRRAQLEDLPQRHIRSVTTSPEELEVYPEYSAQMETFYQEALQDQTPVLLGVAAPRLRSKPDDALHRAILDMGDTHGEWVFVTTTRTVGTYLQEELAPAHSLGELQDMDTPEVLETAKVLFQDASTGSPLQKDGAALPGARLLNA